MSSGELTTPMSFRASEATRNLSLNPNSKVTQTYTYDPFGEITSPINPNELVFAHNAEEYNPVVDLTYLRARYYAPSSANFITQDSILGSITSINSQNRYSFAESDPVNNFDPSGHAIGNTVPKLQ
jgi:RHS repeat-associated protein